MLIKREGSTETTLVKAEDKVVTKEVMKCLLLIGMKDKKLETSFAERRDIITSGKIAQTTDLVLITKTMRAMQMKVDLQGEESNLMIEK